MMVMDAHARRERKIQNSEVMMEVLLRWWTFVVKVECMDGW